MKLLELQRKMAKALMQPLARDDKQSRKTDVSYIKPNDRLRSIDRLEIYSRSYWYRIIDSMFEDFPGLLAVLGMRAFNRLVRAYLADCPSRSYTLRDLGSQLYAWMKKHPKFAGPKQAVALDMVRLEWAHIEAWDAATLTTLGPEHLIELGPELPMSLQPHVRLIELSYPVDGIRIRANETMEDHEVASNAPSKLKRRRILAAVGRLRKQKVFIAVHRLDFSIYYRHLEPEEHRLLCAIRDSKTIGEAMTAFYKSSPMPLEELEPRIEGWFKIWAELGWLCAMK